MMTDELNSPAYKTPDAASAVPAQTGCSEMTVPVPASPLVGNTMDLTFIQEAFCKKIKREIKRYGVEQALSRWRVMCDYMQTEDWWPAVARKVEDVIDEAFEERERQQQAERERQRAALVSLSVSQMQSNKEKNTDNHFENGSSSQVFNDEVNGNFEVK